MYELPISKDNKFERFWDNFYRQCMRDGPVDYLEFSDFFYSRLAECNAYKSQSSGHLIFKTEADALAFILKWS